MVNTRLDTLLSKIMDKNVVDVRSFSHKAVPVKQSFELQPIRLLASESQLFRSISQLFLRGSGKETGKSCCDVFVDAIHGSDDEVGTLDLP